MTAFSPPCRRRSPSLLHLKRMSYFDEFIETPLVILPENNDFSSGCRFPSANAVNGQPSAKMHKYVVPSDCLTQALAF